ncbi:Clavaminate synthase-like protein [Rhizodiscina lignyota]|uniref:Clavaminate synthase-like protein n=1 Tax=Rhizodiscina lignyota TaxID=1504668 RepID=A0A9P4ILE4_9PEZI|nr:Clavaminate synthase-like protein [Rhizodiscina lignyota]
MGSTIPTIDFRPFINGSLQERQQIATNVDDALRTVGFFRLYNHGIGQGKIEQCFNWSKQFFHLPDDEKETLSPTPPSFDRGFFALGKEKVRGQISMKENYDFSDAMADTAWPKGELLPRFREFAADFHQDCSRLVYRLLDCVSMALQLSDEQSLRQYHTGTLFTSSLNHYPSVPAQLLQSGEAARSPAHADFGTLSLIFQRNVGGLEIADMKKTATFIHINPEPGSIIVFGGYLLNRWTDKRYRGAVHRVTEPSHLECGMEILPERYSVVFFSFPDAATTIEPLASCCSDENPRKYEAINAGEYLQKKKAVIYT